MKSQHEGGAEKACACGKARVRSCDDSENTNRRTVAAVCERI